MKSAELSEAARLDWALSQLRASVRRLATSPGEQVAWLKEIGTFPLADELALEFDDAFLLVDQLVGAGRVSPAAQQQLSEIDTLLTALSHGPEEGWLPDALACDERWAQVRERAAKALRSIS